MKIIEAKYTTSAVDKKGLIDDGKAQFAFVGRSNVGKSSLINRLTGQKRLAKTSSTPGLTKMVNYFLVNESFYFVDLPGYGYAKTNRKNKNMWAEIIGLYLTDNSNLQCVFVLFDIRHSPTELDREMIKFLSAYGISFKILLTKADKLAKSKIFQALGKIAKELGLRQEAFTAVSSESGYGIENLLNFIEGKLEA